ncbi:beta-1,4-N-acetylglucosaminyltransferase [Fonticula alba]|uniref:UDP-N-acetylglucosamine transferase subunit ALG14 n=1 Tax=Fonticula alba TaxID=691883 RepID=A0A058ZI40_FONAL|nr:beta-1,4-N-acetylglucosaminyltransferase [Fonticula alba]KCV73192.1 beta-1,4-N-acetylglucosaminyltransferase [Fonticula alba]|eukprot:XP_009492893.1 beta-1,4-N-acetylglucosaminyltransferase [Fonticula alba]
MTGFCCRTKASFHTIPRSRNVGQSYISSIFTTLNALLFSIFLIWSEQPDMLVCNGPGTCLPLVFVAKLLRILHLGHCRVVFVESVARVNTLSLTGRIFSTLRLADRFVVHWAQLAGPNSNIHPKPEYFGLLV